MKLADKLEKLRIEKGKTKQQVANETGLGITSIKNYENKKMNRIPDTNAIKKLKEYYNVAYEYLLDEDCPYISIDDTYVRGVLEENEKLKAKLEEINRISRF